MYDARIYPGRPSCQVPAGRRRAWAEGPTLEREDQRRDYGETRFIAIGLAQGIALTVVYTDRAESGAVVAASSRLARAMNVNVKRTSKPSRKSEKPRRGRADPARLRKARERTIKRTSPPELADLPPNFFAEASIVQPRPKRPISLRVDEDVLRWFKAQGPRYQSRMNAVLRAYMAAVQKGAA